LKKVAEEEFLIPAEVRGKRRRSSSDRRIRPPTVQQVQDIRHPDAITHRLGQVQSQKLPSADDPDQKKGEDAPSAADCGCFGTEFGNGDDGLLTMMMVARVHGLWWGKREMKLKVWRS
jgi:hypothetical protein